MIRDVLTALGYCLFIWIVYVGAVKVFTGQWLWQVWKQKKEIEKEWKQQLADLDRLEEEMKGLKELDEDFRSRTGTHMRYR